MHISPFIVYLILKMDDFQSLFGWATAIMVIACIVSGLVLLANSVEDNKSEETKSDIAFLSKWWLGFLAMIILNVTAYFLTPSTKQMAGVILIPAIVNNETIQKDAGELYQLAKETLTDLVRKADPKNQEQKQQ